MLSNNNWAKLVGSMPRWASRKTPNRRGISHYASSSSLQDLLCCTSEEEEDDRMRISNQLKEMRWSGEQSRVSYPNRRIEAETWGISPAIGLCLVGEDVRSKEREDNRSDLWWLRRPRRRWFWWRWAATGCTRRSVGPLRKEREREVGFESRERRRWMGLIHRGFE